MNNVNMFFDRPWLLFLIIPALAIILIPHFLQPARKRKKIKKILPVILHVIISILLTLLVAGLTFASKSDNQAIMLVLDFSNSTKTVQENITECAEDIMKNVDGGTIVGVVAFGADTVYSVELGYSKKDITPVEVQGDATDIGAALEYAASLVPEDKNCRIILMSDGNENQGDGAAAAYKLSNQDVRIDTVYFNSASPDKEEIQVDSLTAADTVYIGDTLSLTADIKSNTGTSAVLNLYDNGGLVSTNTYELAEGSNVFKLSAEPKTSGVHEYKLVIASEGDNTEENNEMTVCVGAYDGPSVLIIYGSGTDSTMLEELLAENMNVSAVKASKAPDTIMEFCDYDEIILLNASTFELPDKFDELTKKYVEDYGRGLLVVGGSSTLVYGGMAETEFEEILPVTFEYNKAEEGESVALVLVLDCSMSMSNNSTNLQVAKQGAIKSVEAMTENDYVGIISFNSRAYVNSELIKATEINKENLVRIISELSTSRGTYYTEALYLAYEQLILSNQEKRHILFLSDGQPSDSNYMQVVDLLAADGITVSTIGLGYSSSILENIADVTGGRYYYVSSAKDLPNIMLSETEQVAANSLVLGETVPVVAVKSALTNGVSGDSAEPKNGAEGDNEQTGNAVENNTAAGSGSLILPALQGFLGLTTKEDATAFITNDEGDPIYAEWKYGEGHVAVFTSDLTEEWSGEWLNSEVGREIIKRMVTTTVNAVHSDTSLATDISVEGTAAEIIITTSGTSTNHTVSATITEGTEAFEKYQTSMTSDGGTEGSPESKTGTEGTAEGNADKAAGSGNNDGGGDAADTEAASAAGQYIEFEQTNIGIYKSSFDVEYGKTYSIHIEECDQRGKQLDSADVLLTAAYPAEYDAFAEGGLELLSTISSFTGGVTSDDMKYLASVSAAVSVTNYIPVTLFGIIILILLLADIAIRKLRLKDLKNYVKLIQFRLKRKY